MIFLSHSSNVVVRRANARLSRPLPVSSVSGPSGFSHGPLSNRVRPSSLVCNISLSLSLSLSLVAHNDVTNGFSPLSRFCPFSRRFLERVLDRDTRDQVFVPTELVEDPRGEKKERKERSRATPRRVIDGHPRKGRRWTHGERCGHCPLRPLLSHLFDRLTRSSCVCCLLPALRNRLTRRSSPLAFTLLSRKPDCRTADGQRPARGDLRNSSLGHAYFFSFSFSFFFSSARCFIRGGYFREGWKRWKKFRFHSSCWWEESRYVPNVCFYVFTVEMDGRKVSCDAIRGYRRGLFHIFVVGLIKNKRVEKEGGSRNEFEGSLLCNNNQDWPLKVHVLSSSDTLVSTTGS